MSKWLENYEYQVSLSASVFIWALGGAGQSSAVFKDGFVNCILSYFMSFRGKLRFLEANNR